jgi:hypothetical protein
MMKMILEAMKQEREETRKLTMNLLYPMQQVVTPATGPIVEEQPELTYDYDQTPLSEGIQAVLDREEEEDRLRVLMKERVGLQGRLRTLQEEELRATEEQNSSRGPWDGVPRGGV